MKRILPVIGMIISLHSGLFCAQQTISPDYMVESNFHDVAIFSGSDQPYGPITKGFVRSICHAQYPIVVSNSLFRNFIKEHNTPGTDYSQVSFNDTDWLIYASFPSAYLLLIPRRYYNAQNKKFPSFEHLIEVQVNGRNERYTRKEIILGFAVDHFDILVMRSTNDYELGGFGLSELEKPSNAIIDTAMRVFIKGKEPIFGLWNVYLDGHGEYPRIPHNESLPSIINQFDSLGAKIAGIPLDEYSKFIRFLTQEISTNILYYSTCFGGDVNLILPYITYVTNIAGNVIGNVEKHNFVIAVGALTSITVDLMGISAVCGVFQEEDIFNVRGFFDQLHIYSNKKSNQPTIFKDSELVNILSPLHPKYRGLSETPEQNLAYELSHQPSVIFPKTDTPRALPLTEDIAVISKTLATKHALEKQPIVLDNKKAILIYPETIDVPIQINRANQIPAIVSMIPGVGLHKLKDIKTTLRGIDLWRCFSFITPQFEKYFFIEQTNRISITGLNLSGSNVIIRTALLEQLNQKPKTDILYTDGKNNIHHTIIQGEEEANIEIPFTFQTLIPNNALANALVNYRQINEPNFNFDTDFGWAELIQVLSKEDRQAIERYENPLPELPPSAGPTPTLEEPAMSTHGEQKLAPTKQKIRSKRKPITRKKAPSKTSIKKTKLAQQPKPFIKKKKIIKKTAAAKVTRPVRKPFKAKQQPTKVRRISKKVAAKLKAKGKK